MAQQAEHVLGKDEVTGSNPVNSFKKRQLFKVVVFYFLHIISPSANNTTEVI